MWPLRTLRHKSTAPWLWLSSFQNYEPPVSAVPDLSDSVTTAWMNSEQGRKGARSQRRNKRGRTRGGGWEHSRGGEGTRTGGWKGGADTPSDRTRTVRKHRSPTDSGRGGSAHLQRQHRKGAPGDNLGDKHTNQDSFCVLNEINSIFVIRQAGGSGYCLILAYVQDDYFKSLSIWMMITGNSFRTNTDHVHV